MVEEQTRSCFETPRFIRVDAGKEFAGEFANTCTLIGIKLRVTSAGVPQSNRQVERWNREVKKVLRKYPQGDPQSYWCDWLGHVRAGLRTCVCKSNRFLPFAIVFKQDPGLPATCVINPDAHIQLDIDVEDKQQLAKQLIAVFKKVLQQIWESLSREDDKAKEYYETVQLWLTVVCQGGQQLLVKFPKLGKLAPKVDPEPVVFARYLSKAKVMAMKKAGKTKEIYVQLLAPTS